MDEREVGRRVAVILAADVVGYSRMMSADETWTHRTWQEILATIITAKLGTAGGRIFKTIGDGVLAEFSSAINAVQYAIDVQQALLAFNRGVSPERVFQLRIGINLGDVIIEGDDLLGDGVNVAARLEGAAEPGAIAIADTVHRMVQGKISADCEDRGEIALKNIAEPVRIYQIKPSAPSEKRSQDAPSGKSRPPAVAVLPFSNMSGDPEQEYFSDGLTEDIITALSHWRSIPVIARNSTFTYKGKSVRVQTVAEELGVRYVLEGSVRKAGNRLRITAQLIDADTAHHVWAQKFDSLLDDVFDLQDQITNQIAATIVPELEQFENRRSSRRTGNLGAWDYYLRGLQTFYDETCAGTAAAQKHFLAAVEADPEFSDAWARLGWTYAKQVMHGCPVGRDETLGKGFEAARKAISLDASSALAHMSLGTVHIWSNDMRLGLAEAQRAVELNPNFAHAAMAYGNRLDLNGHTEQGIKQMEQALTLNPRDPIRWRYMAYLSRAYVSINDYQQAAEWGRQAVLLRPDLPEALFRYAVCLAHLDRVEEAGELIRQCAELDAAYFARMSDWKPYEDEARNRHILSGLRRHGLIPSP